MAVIFGSVLAKINVGCLLLRSEMNDGNIRFRMLKSYFLDALSYFRIPFKIS